MIFPLLWLKLQGVSPKVDFFFPDEELLLDQGLEKKGFVMRPWFVSAAAGCWVGPERWLGLLQRWDFICIQPLQS